jgi:uncharacterized protein (DUF849 family)
MKRAACACVVSLGVLAFSHAAPPPIPKAVPAQPTYRFATPPVPMITKEHQTAQQLYAAAVKDCSAGNFEAAKTGFQKVLAISPENPPTLINLALIAQRQERNDDAEQFLRRVIQKDTANATAWLLLGIGAYDRNEFDAAHAHLAQAVLYGGHVRVGLEDNLYLEKGVFGSNGQLVEKAVKIIRLLGADVMTPAEVRQVLKLRGTT